jgi:hypothetical protein
MCLLFRCLPQQTLNTWLPRDVRQNGDFGALNIASPLDNGAREREWVDLSAWNDPLVQEYIGGDRKRSSVAYTKARLPENGEEAERELKRDVAYRKSKQPDKVQNVIQITTPGLLLIGAAVLTGFLLLRNGTGPARR